MNLFSATTTDATDESTENDQPTMDMDVAHGDGDSTSGVEQPSTDSRLGRIANSKTLASIVGGTDDFTPQDRVRVQRAFRHEYAVERSDQNSVVGAISISPASMSMVDESEVRPHIRSFASILSMLPDGARGMLVDVPRAVDYSSRREAFADHQGDLADDGSFHAQLQADIAEEREQEAMLYQETSHTLDHYIVLEVTELDAARTLSDSNGGLADLPVIGQIVKERRADQLREDNQLTNIMVSMLTKRLDSMAEHLSKLEGIDAHPVTSAAYSQLIADYYRPDDMYAFDNFESLVRQSPVPDDDGGGSATDPRHAVNHDTDIDGQTISTLAEDGQLTQQYKSLLCPRPFERERDGAITVGRSQRSATLAITGWPEVPPIAFLEPLYRYEKPGVEVTIATHFVRKPDQQSKRQAKQQENALKDKAESKRGSVFEEKYDQQLKQASEFADGLESTDYGAFEAGLFVTVKASNKTINDNGDVVESDDRLDDAVDDVKLILREECGFDATRFDHNHERGWQTTAPLANNELGENTTLLGNALARQWPYQYRNRQDPNGVKMGLHEYLREPTTVDIFDLENGYNGGIYGSIGSGKTTTLQDVANAMKLKHDAEDIPFKLIFSTPVEDFKSLCETYDGEHVVVGSDAAVNPLQIRWVPPEKLEEVGDLSPWTEMVTRAMGFLESYYDLFDLSNFGEKRDTWRIAIKNAQRRKGITPGTPETYKFNSAVIPDVIEVFEEMVDDASPYVRESLQDDQKTVEDREQIARDILTHDVEAFEPDGRFSHFTEPSSVDLQENDVVYLDFQKYESNEQAGGLEMLMRLYDLYDQQKVFDGRTFMAIDEFHYMLKNPRAAEFFEQTHLHSRHWDLAVWLSTQEIGHLFEKNDKGDIGLTDTAQSIFNNQAMQFYHYTKEMNDAWAGELDLSDRSHEYIDNAAMGRKTDGYSQALFVVEGTEYPLRIEMSDELNPRQFALYQHDPTSHPPLREYLANYTDSNGNDPCNWRWSQ